MSPREYAARLDLLRVQDCLWARMKPTAIARKLGKDKAWVSRAIARIREEQATAFQSPTERELTKEHLAQLDMACSPKVDPGAMRDWRRDSAAELSP